MRVTVCISTKDRRNVLHQPLWSLRNQTFKEWDLVLVDDDSAPWDPAVWQNDQFYGRILSDLVESEHRVQIASGAKNGRVGASFQSGFAFERANWANPIFFRCDDDTWLPPNYLETLVKHFEKPDVGAVAGLVFHPAQKIETFTEFDPRYKHATIKDLSDQINVQWFRHTSQKLILAEHLHHVQLLRAEALEKINGFDTELYHGYREETQYSYRIFLEGYKLIIDPTVECWHFRAPGGGLPSLGNIFLEDVRTFNMQCKTLKPGIHVAIGHAIGDAIIATPMIEELKRQHPDREITVFHPHAKAVFEGNPNITAIANDPLDAQRTARLTGSIYAWASGKKWKGHLAQAYCEMFNVPTPKNSFPKLYGFNGHKEKIICLAPWSMAHDITMKGPSHNKNWFEDQWLSLVEWLKTEYPKHAIIQLGDFERYNDPEPLIPGAKPFKGKLRESWQKIKSAELLISVDTAAQHVGAAFGTPMVVIFGRSVPQHFGYDGGNIINLQGICPGFPVKQTIKEEGQVPREITVIQERPCVNGSQWNVDQVSCPIVGRPCMSSISVEMVKEAVQGLMKDAK